MYDLFLTIFEANLQIFKVIFRFFLVFLDFFDTFVVRLIKMNDKESCLVEITWKLGNFAFKSLV